MKSHFFTTGLPESHCTRIAAALQCIAALKGSDPGVLRESEREFLIGVTEDRTAALAGLSARQGTAWGREISMRRAPV